MATKQLGRVDLSEAVRLVIVQFRFSKAEQIPQPLSERLRVDSEDRKSRTSGTLSVQPVSGVNPGGLLGELESAGYTLVEAFCKGRTDESNPQWMREYSVAQFVFARSGNAFMLEEFRAIRDDIRQNFRVMAECAMWRARIYTNPFYKDGEVVEGASSLSVNLDERKPYLRPDGQPEMLWAKDGQGEKVGEAPSISIKAAYRLRVANEAPVSGVLIETLE